MAGVRLLAVAGSTRAESLNQRLLDVAVGLAREAGAEVTTISLRDFDLPLFDGDLEARSFPAAADRLRALFVEHDGFLIASPEYNGGVSGVLKNAIDWASRPQAGQPQTALAAFRGKTAGLMSASISPFGGLRGLIQLRQILATIQTLAVTEQVLLPFADKAFDGADLREAMPKQLLGLTVNRVILLAAALKTVQKT